MGKNIHNSMKICRLCYDASEVIDAVVGSWYPSLENTFAHMPRPAPRRGRTRSLGLRSLRLSSGWKDVSVPIQDGMVHWPGDPAVRIRKIKDLARGDSNTLSAVSMGLHTGTHMDAPSHFLKGKPGIDALPFEATVGTARIIQIRDPNSITLKELAAHRIERGERLLFKTRNSSRCWKNRSFVKDFVYLSTEAARFLSHRRVRTVGIDYLSVGGYLEKNGVPVHRILLGSGIWIIEGLNLSSVRPGKVELICLPLRVLGGDGAPARAIVRPV